MTGENNAVIGFPSWRGKCTFSLGSWEADYPVSNLSTLPLNYVARSTDLDAASTQWKATFDKARGIRLLGLIRHNLTLDATFRLKLYADSALSTLLFDSGWVDVWLDVYKTQERTWADSNFWGGKYTQEEIDDAEAIRPIFLDQQYIAEAFTVEILDPTNPAGFIQVGLMEVAQGWQVQTNFGYGAEYGFENRTTVEEAEGGVEYFDIKDSPTVFNGSIKSMNRDEALSKAFEHQRQMGIHTPFLWMPHPNEPLHWLRNTALVRNKDLGLMGYASHNRDSVPLQFKRIL